MVLRLSMLSQCAICYKCVPFMKTGQEIQKKTKACLQNEPIVGSLPVTFD